jgi:hypothetical protein
MGDFLVNILLLSAHSSILLREGKTNHCNRNTTKTSRYRNTVQNYNTNVSTPPITIKESGKNIAH